MLDFAKILSRLAFSFCLLLLIFFLKPIFNHIKNTWLTLLFGSVYSEYFWKILHKNNESNFLVFITYFNCTNPKIKLNFTRVSSRGAKETYLSRDKEIKLDVASISNRDPTGALSMHIICRNRAEHKKEAQSSEEIEIVVVDNKLKPEILCRTIIPLLILSSFKVELVLLVAVTMLEAILKIR